MEKENESDIDNIDFANFKGIYIDEDPNRKFQDPETGCHFEYYDLCKRLAKLKQLRKRLDRQLGLPETPEEEILAQRKIYNNKSTDQDNQKKAMQMLKQTQPTQQPK